MTTWGKVHGSITWHAKALAAGDAALGVWVRLLGHCAQHLTDGFVAAPVAIAVGSSSPGAVEALVRAGLLEPSDGGYRLHDYLEHNSSRVDIEASREASRARKARSRSTAKAMLSRVTGRVTDGVSPAGSPFAGEREIEIEIEEEERNTSSPANNVAQVETKPLTLGETETGADAPASASAGGVVVELFRHWQRVHAHPQAKLDAKRRRAIERAVKSHGADVVRAAIDGCAKSAFHKGQNDRGAVYDDLTLILRDASKIEAFAALAPKDAPKPLRSVPVRASSDPFSVSPFPDSVYRKASGQ